MSEVIEGTVKVIVDACFKAGYEKGRADGRKEMLVYLERIMWERYNKINRRGKGYVESFIMWCVKELKRIEEDWCYNASKEKEQNNG